ncbi:hypothetical protein GCM10026983_18620 [Gracilibacillus alcaliphilus]
MGACLDGWNFRLWQMVQFSYYVVFIFISVSRYDNIQKRESEDENDTYRKYIVTMT